MRYAVTVISVAYDLSWVSRSASHGKVSTVGRSAVNISSLQTEILGGGSAQHKDSTGIPDHPHLEHIRLRFSRPSARQFWPRAPRDRSTLAAVTSDGIERRL